MKVFVTGGAGFIGTHLVRRLKEQDHQVTVYDKVNGDDLGNMPRLLLKIPEHDIVCHLAANVDTRAGLTNFRTDFDGGTVATHNLLLAMHRYAIKSLVYASSATVYGDLASSSPVSEHTPLVPISLYGASKVACEAMINAYVHMFDLHARAYRMGNIVGPEVRMGVIYDLVNKLKEDPNELQVLGDGTAERSFLRIEDCVDGLLGQRKEGTYNLGNTDTLAIKELVNIVCEEMNVRPKIAYTGGRRGWRGDAPVVRLDTAKIRLTGWKPSCISEEAVRRAVRCLI